MGAGEVGPLTGYGAILEMTPEDNDVDLIADEVTLIAGGDITGLEIAVNTIVEVGSDTGSIGLSDFDGVDEKRPGLVVMSATSLSANTVSVAISAGDDLNVGRLNSDDTMDTGSVSVGGAHSTIELASSNGNFVVYEGGTMAVSGGLVLEAGGLVRAPGLPMVSDRVEIRAGTTFEIEGVDQLDLTADSIILETGRTLTIDGTLTGATLVELISNQGNVNISGSIAGASGTLTKTDTRHIKQQHIIKWIG